jgi:hypothetical protein
VIYITDILVDEGLREAIDKNLQHLLSQGCVNLGFISQMTLTTMVVHLEQERLR